jgi:hypothetical protein
MKSAEGKDGATIELTSYRVAYLSRSIPWDMPKVMEVNAVNKDWIYDNWHKLAPSDDYEIAAIRINPIVRARGRQ